MPIPLRIPLLPAVIAAVLTLSGCAEDAAEGLLPLVTVNPETTPVNDPVPDPVPDPEVIPEPIEPTGIISEVAIDEIQGVFTAGAPPTAIGMINLSPLSLTNEPVQFISGGSTQIPLQSDVPFVTAYVVVDTEGYFTVDLPIEKLFADLVITFSTIQLEGQIDEIAVSVASAVGDISGAEKLPVSSVVVGTGDLQVSMSWDTPTDLDLRLVEPDGTNIYFANKVSASGGTLDLDSNVLCFIDGVNNENITYENVVPPSGEYTVQVTYFSDCRIDRDTNFVVTVRTGGEVQTFSGSVNAADVGSRQDITTFEIR